MHGILIETKVKAGVWGGVVCLVFRNEFSVLLQSSSFGFFEAETEFFKGFFSCSVDFLKLMD